MPTPVHDRLEEQLTRAVGLHQAGRHADAEAAYRELLERDPSCARGWHYFGLLSLQQGEPERATELMRRALALDPDDPACHSNLGNALKRLGRTDEAREAYLRALALAPDFAEAAFNLGTLCELTGDAAGAAHAYRKAVRAKPALREAWRRLAGCMARADLAAEAAPVLRELAARFADDVEILVDLARGWRSIGDTGQALAVLRGAAGRGRHSPVVARELGALLIELRSFGDAKRVLSEALRRMPRDPELLNLHGSALTLAGELTQAEQSFRDALAASAGFVPALNNLGNCLKDSGRVEEAVAVYREALEHAPDDLSAHSNLLFSLHYSPSRTPAAIHEAHLAFGQRFLPSPAPASARTDDDRPLKVGLVSPDFNRHPVGEFLKPLFRHAGAAGLSLHAYYTGEIEDNVTGLLRSFASGWIRCAGWSDDRLAARIRDDAIDCLIDLAGHTAGNRLALFARRAAPVQATWLGYPDTTGVAAIDWRITDARADPPGMTESLHAEKLLRLPSGFLSYEPPDPALPIVPPRATGEIRFGCFNHLPKMRNPVLLAAWARILKATPGSRLLLKTTALSDRGVRAGVLAELASLGVGPERAILRGRDSRYQDHLRAYGEVDVLLDPFPYNGTTMTCEGLWMGVPVVTLAGAAHVSRVGCSLLAQAGLEEWVAADVDAYVALAVRMAGELKRSVQARIALRERVLASPLCDGSGFVREFATGLREACRCTPAAGGSP